MIRGLLLGMLVLLSSACTTIATYDIDQARIESQLQEGVRRFDKEQAASGSPLSLSLEEVHLDIGPEDREVVVVDAKGQVALTAFLAKIPVDLHLKVEGTPVYESEQKAIFIRRLTLIDSDVRSPLFKGDNAAVVQALMATLSQLLENTPVYRLDESDPRQRLLAAMPVDIVVGRGKLRIVPARH